MHEASPEFVPGLVPLDRSNWRAALLVCVADDQLAMVADHQPVAAMILAKAYIRPDGRRWEPLGFVDSDGTIVAVLALTHADTVTEIRNLAVDIQHQRSGVGSAVMNAVIERCRLGTTSSLELTFHPHNEAAARLYHGAGLRPTGETRDGEAVWSIDVTAES